jgi:hypothetical protein
MARKPPQRRRRRKPDTQELTSGQWDGIRQREVDKLDPNDYNPRFRHLTLPDNETGDYAKCPIINEEKCQK